MQKQQNRKLKQYGHSGYHISALLSLLIILRLVTNFITIIGAASATIQLVIIFIKIRSVYINIAKVHLSIVFRIVLLIYGLYALALIYENVHYQLLVDFCIILLVNVPIHRSLIPNFEKFKYKEFLKIDGSYGEGGGQIIRNSMAYSAILEKPIHIFNIRAGRKVSGLRDQHSCGISLVHQICSHCYNNQYLAGNRTTSTEVKYDVGSAKMQQDLQFYNKELHYFVDTNSKASIALIIQISLPILLFSASATTNYLKIIGGTNASKFAPHIDYTINILKPMLLRLMNININIEIIKRGFLSTNGGGICILKTDAIIGSLPSFELTQRGSKISEINGICIVHTTVDQLQVFENYTKELVKYTQEKLHKLFNNIKATEIKINVEFDSTDSMDDETTIILQLFAQTDTHCLFGASSMESFANNTCIAAAESIKLNMTACSSVNVTKLKQIALNVCNELMSDYSCCSHSCVDKHLQDQLIIFMALATGKSRMIIGTFEEHTKTAIHFAELMTGSKFNVEKFDKNNASLIVECQGIGFQNKFVV